MARAGTSPASALTGEEPVPGAGGVPAPGVLGTGESLPLGRKRFFSSFRISDRPCASPTTCRTGTGRGRRRCPHEEDDGVIEQLGDGLQLEEQRQELFAGDEIALESGEADGARDQIRMLASQFDDAPGEGFIGPAQAGKALPFVLIEADGEVDRQPEGRDVGGEVPRGSQR